MTARNNFGGSALEITRIVGEFYKSRIGSLSLSIADICLCTIREDCSNSHDGPLTVPGYAEDAPSVVIHIKSDLVSSIYPCQIVYQFSHEIWHAYEFAIHGINYDYEHHKYTSEPYAHAASLCILSECIMPDAIMPNSSQVKYFNNAKDNTESIREIYRPGVSLAKSVDYDINKLLDAYMDTTPL